MEMLKEPKESKPSPAPPHCHHRLRTRPTGGQTVNNCFQHNTDINYKHLLPVKFTK